LTDQKEGKNLARSNETPGLWKRGSCELVQKSRDKTETEGYLEKKGQITQGKNLGSF